MAWANSHILQFSLGDVIISGPVFNLDEYEGYPPVTDEKTVTVEAVVEDRTAIIAYEYDFGASWSHVPTFRPLAKRQHPVENRAVCIEGERACSPEDCGSIPGYEALLKALLDKKHPENRSMKQWLGRPYNPEALSVAKANRFLAKLSWPKVSVAALTKAIKARNRSKSGFA